MLGLVKNYFGGTMKKLFSFWGLLTLALLLLFPGKTNALIPPQDITQNSQTTQYYSVVFDKEQEATVLAVLTYANIGTQEIKDFTLEVPGNQMRIINVLQQYQDTQKFCAEYDYTKRTPMPSTYTTPNVYQSPNCLRWEDRSIGTYKYAKLETTSDVKDSSVNLKVTFKKAIPTQNSGTIMLYYKAKGYTTKEWDGYAYNFQTIKSNYDIDTVRAAVNVSDDLYIKPTSEGQTNYESNYANALPKAASFQATDFAASEEISQISNTIVSAPGVVEEASNLDPNENMSVKGKYYDNNWMGELPTIIGVGATFLLILVVLAMVIRKDKSFNK
ncbi:MAG: hypothetical protein HW405_484 [Candidatus Berkelbacteria bacterium]|nr:hypothetical protein [Candidatus Berkelbacteria bacterium]